MLSDFKNFYKDMSLDTVYSKNGSLHVSEMSQIITPDNKNQENRHARQNTSPETCNMEMIYNKCGMQQEKVASKLISNYLNIIFHLNPEKYKNELLLILKDPKKHAVSQLLDILRMLDYKKLYDQQSLLGNSLLRKESAIVNKSNVVFSPLNTEAYRISSYISSAFSNSSLGAIENSEYFPLYPVTACSDLHNFEAKMHPDFFSYFSKMTKIEKESRQLLNVTNSNSNIMISNTLQRYDFSSFLPANKESVCKFIEVKSVNKSSNVEKENEFQHLTNFSHIMNDTELKNKKIKLSKDTALACSDNLSEIGSNKKNPNLLNEGKENFCQENSLEFNKSKQFEYEKYKIFIEPSESEKNYSDILGTNLKNVDLNTVETINDSKTHITSFPVSSSKNSGLHLFNVAHKFLSSASHSNVSSSTLTVPKLHVMGEISEKKASINEIICNERVVTTNKGDNMNPVIEYMREKVHAQPLLPIVNKHNFTDENENNEYLLLTTNETKKKKSIIKSTKILAEKDEVSNECNNSIIVSMDNKSFEVVNTISKEINSLEKKEDKNEGDGQKRRCINKCFTEKTKLAEDTKNSSTAENKNYMNKDKIDEEIQNDETVRSHSIFSVLGIKGKTEVVVGDNKEEKQLTLPENPLDRFFCQKYLLGLLHFSRLYGQFFAIHNAAEFTQFLKKKIEIRIKAMLPGMIEAYQYRLDPVYHALTENKDFSCSKLTKTNLVAFQYLKPLINFFKLKARDEKIIQEIKKGISDNRRRRGIGGINRGHKGHKKDADFEKSNIRALKNEDITDLSGFYIVDGFVQDFKDKEICNQYSGDTPEGKAEEFANVAHSQRRLMQKLTPLDYRAYLLSNQTARKIFPEKFRMQQLRMIETCHYDLEDEPKKLIGPLVLADALFPNKTNDLSELIGLLTTTIPTKENPVNYTFLKAEVNPENTLFNNSGKTQLNKNNIKLKSRNLHANFEENDYLLQTKKRGIEGHNINSCLNSLSIACDVNRMISEPAKKNLFDSGSCSSNNNRNSKSTLNDDAIIFLNETISNTCNNSQLFQNIKPIITDKTNVQESNTCTDLSLKNSCKNNLGTLIEMKQKIDSNSNNTFPTPGQSVLDFIMLQDIDFVKINDSKNKLRNRQNNTGNGGKSNKKRLRTTMLSSNRVSERSFPQQRGKQSGRISNMALGLSQKTLLAASEMPQFPVTLR